MNLSDVVSVEFYKKSTTNENIELDVILNKLPTNYQNETYLAQILLKNPSSNIIDLSGKQCLITISNSAEFEIIDSCYSNTELFHPNENIYSGHIIISKQKYDLSQYKDKHIKVIVEEKTDTNMFGEFIDRLHNEIDTHEVNVIEDSFNINASADVNVVDQGEDTLTFLQNYIDSLDTELDKGRMKDITKEFYNEVQDS